MTRKDSEVGPSESSVSFRVMSRLMTRKAVGFGRGRSASASESPLSFPPPPFIRTFHLPGPRPGPRRSGRPELKLSPSRLGPDPSHDQARLRVRVIAGMTAARASQIRLSRRVPRSQPCFKLRQRRGTVTASATRMQPKFRRRVSRGVFRITTA
jgi:hypothetical protein